MNAESTFLIRCAAIVSLSLCFSLRYSYAQTQETVFTFLKSDEKKANEYFAQKKYSQALSLYESMSAKSHTEKYSLPIARAYFYLHQPADAVTWFSRAVASNSNLPDKDILLFAESLSAVGKYDEAIKFFAKYQALHTDDGLVMKKIWQLKNRTYLFEDSIHYDIQRTGTNSGASDICAVPYRDGFVFLSNRKRQKLIDKVDGNNRPFFSLYYSVATIDTTASDLRVSFNAPEKFDAGLSSRYQRGAVSFYGGEQSLALIATGEASMGKRSLQLYFTSLVAGEWIAHKPFVFNNPEFSYTAVAMQEDGQVLYVASDMPGGFGGLDIYRSTFANGQWTKPQNLGELINTAGDENYPSVLGNALYFSSTGHPGLGGMDIFKAMKDGEGFGESVNLGYPVSTNFDDFALSLTNDGSRGFLSSNRDGSDDVYELISHLRSFPFTIAGLLKVKDESWSESGELRIFPNAQLSLIDNQKNTVVQNTTSDDDGLFSLTIPYFSQYRIKIVSEKDAEEVVVSLDLSKTRSGENKYEIVVVRNAFKKAY
ncbi:MAG: tetratricopeptide repeat protein [Chryseolinea sp.]